nr:hypothetical protein [Tissierella sp.]
MKNIAIVDREVVGLRPRMVSMGLEINPFKKSLARKFSEELNERLIEKDSPYRSDVDHSFEILDDLIKDGIDLILISPHIVHNRNIKGIDPNSYYFLSEDEYLNTKVDLVLKCLEDLQKL